MEAIRPAEEPTVTGAIDRVVDAAQSLVTDEITLARMNLEAAIVGTFAGSALVAIGVCLALGAWGVLMIAAYDILTTRVSPLVGLAAIAVVNLVAAIGFIASGAARLREPAGAPAVLDRR